MPNDNPQTTKHSYTVIIPIAGNVTIEVAANSPEEAKTLALDGDLSKGDLYWETLDAFNTGNVCHCPSPWEIEIEDNGEIEE